MTLHLSWAWAVLVSSSVSGESACSCTRQGRRYLQVCTQQRGNNDTMHPKSSAVCNFSAVNARRQLNIAFTRKSSRKCDRRVITYITLLISKLMIYIKWFKCMKYIYSCEKTKNIYFKRRVWLFFPSYRGVLSKRWWYLVRWAMIHAQFLGRATRCQYLSTYGPVLPHRDNVYAN